MTVRKITTYTDKYKITIYFGSDTMANETYAVYLDDGTTILEGFYMHFAGFKRHISKFVKDEKQLAEILQIVDLYLFNTSSKDERVFYV